MKRLSRFGDEGLKDGMRSNWGALCQKKDLCLSFFPRARIVWDLRGSSTIGPMRD